MFDFVLDRTFVWLYNLIHNYKKERKPYHGAGTPYVIRLPHSL